MQISKPDLSFFCALLYKYMIIPWIAFFFFCLMHDGVSWLSFTEQAEGVHDVTADT